MQWDRRCSFFFSQGLWGGWSGKSPIMFRVHTNTLNTREGRLNRVEEVIRPHRFDNVALKWAETLLQGQEGDKTSRDFLLKP